MSNNEVETGVPITCRHSLLDVCWRCYVVLDHLGDDRAAGVLQTAVSQLQSQADQIPDLQVRQQFLNNIQSHKAIMSIKA